jgi:hypothetical protein
MAQGIIPARFIEIQTQFRAAWLVVAKAEQEGDEKRQFVAALFD